MKTTYQKKVMEVKGDSELVGQPREIHFTWSADVIVNSLFEILETKNIVIETYDRDGEEIELDAEDEKAVLKLAFELAGERALEQIQVSDFDNDEEEA